jgi:hypothetical protein
MMSPGEMEFWLRGARFVLRGRAEHQAPSLPTFPNAWGVSSAVGRCHCHQNFNQMCVICDSAGVFKVASSRHRQNRQYWNWKD